MEANNILLKIPESITSDNADELRQLIEEVFDPNASLTLDCTDMKMISSAGLRVLLFFQKRMQGGRKIQLIHANQYVCEVFDTTGFRELMDIQRLPRELSIDERTPFAGGLCGECYRLDDEKLLKLYFPNVSSDLIEREKKAARAAFVAGIPTALSYETVRVGERLGIVYELLNAKTLAQTIREDPSSLPQMAKSYARLAKQLHSTPGDPTLFPKWSESHASLLPSMTEYSQSIRDNMLHFLKQIDIATTYVHGDFNINNIMVVDEELMLIDMADFSIGSPMIDVASLYFSFVLLNNLQDDEINSFDGLTGGQEREIFDRFIAEYFHVESFEAAKAHYKETKDMERIAYIKGALFLHLVPNGFPKEQKDKIIAGVTRLFS